jgi:hypothetical protein
MILTPVPAEELGAVLARFAAQLTGTAARTFSRITRLADAERASGEIAERQRQEALARAASVGKPARDVCPSAGFGWSGFALAARTEAYVLLHEVAHFQLAAPARRHLPEFALGAGPETGSREAAAAAQRLFGLEREREEAMASLLGILWEAELGHPALASFLDQNWLEGVGRPGTAAHFATIVGALQDGGYLNAALRPTRVLRRDPDRAVAA